MQIQGKRVLLTGATGGLGRAIAIALAERGAEVVLSSRKRDELEKLALDLKGEGTGSRQRSRRTRRRRGARGRGGEDRRPRRQRRPAGFRLDRGLQPGGDQPRGPRQPRGTDDPRPSAHGPDDRARRGPSRLRLLARRQGRFPARVSVQRDQVRPSRLRHRPPRGPRGEEDRRQRLGRHARASSATPACSPTPARRHPPAVGTATPEDVAKASSRRSPGARLRSPRPDPRPGRRRVGLATPPIRRTRAAGPANRRPPRPPRATSKEASSPRSRTAPFPRLPSAKGSPSQPPRFLRRPRHPGGRRPLLRDLPARRAAGEVRRRAAPVLDQGAAGERAAPRGRRHGQRRPTSRRSPPGTRPRSRPRRSPSSPPAS